MGDEGVDAADVLLAAKRSTGREAAALDSFTIEPLTGAGVNSAVHRVGGFLRDDSGVAPFSVVRKTIRGGTGPVRAWTREPDAYSSGVLSDLAGIDAPTLLVRRNDADGGGCVLWLEDVAADGAPWTLDRFEFVASALGRFAAPYAGGTRVVPTDSWLSIGWLEAWVSVAGPAVEELDRVSDDPLLGRLYPPDVADGMRRLWAERDRIIGAMRRAPLVLGHLDASPSNTVVSGDRVVLLDWAFAGQAALGEDLGCLLGASTLFGDPSTRPSDLPEIASVAFRGYAEGLASGGFGGDPELARWVAAASAALRYAVAPAAFMVKGVGVDGPPPDGVGIRDPEQRAMQERMLGRPFAELLDVMAATWRYLVLELGQSVLSLLPAVERRLP